MSTMVERKPVGRKAFECANRYLGWGDHAGQGLWFVGLEEADYWGRDNLHKYYALGEVDAATTQVDFTTLGNKGRRIRYVTSRIASHVSRRAMAQPEATRWRWYHDNVLWRDGSRICQTNLYPLGKRAFVHWPDDFEELFGFGHADRDAYLKVIRDERFPRLRDRWRKDKPFATICFGKVGWADFRTAFDVKSVARSLANGKVNVHDEERVVLTPFFTRGMTNAAAGEVGHLLRDEWRVDLP